MRLRIILLLVALAACGDNERPQDQPDALPLDAAVDGPMDGPQTATGPCLDRPTDLPMPPTGALPCDMLPPGFAPP